MFGTHTIQSGCFLNNSESGLTISGSNHNPKSKPSLFILSAMPFIPDGSFSLFTYQSPNDDLSSSLFPNHPSSRTNNSIPTSFADLAI